MAPSFINNEEVAHLQALDTHLSDHASSRQAPHSSKLPKSESLQWGFEVSCRTKAHTHARTRRLLPSEDLHILISRCLTGNKKFFEAKLCFEFKDSLEIVLTICAFLAFVVGLFQLPTSVLRRDRVGWRSCCQPVFIGA